MAVKLIDGMPVVRVRLGHSDAFRDYCASQMEPLPRDVEVRALIDTDRHWRLDLSD